MQLARTLLPRVLVIGCLWAVATASLSAQEKGPPAKAPKVFQCRFVSDPIKIDGQADEAAWKHAELIDQFTLPWLQDKDRPAKTSTKARLLWDRDSIYFFAELEDTDLYADVKDHDGMTWDNDVFELFFKPADDKPGYYEFQVNAANTVMDMFLPRRGAGGYPRFKSDGDFHLEAKVALRGTLNKWTDKDQGWSVEGKLPWTDFLRTGGRPDVGERWKFALCRYDFSVEFEGPELSTCAPLNSRPYPDFHRFEDYATLEFVGPQAKLSSRPFGIPGPLPLVTSKVVGSPDPLPPYRAVRAMPELKLTHPICMIQEPGSRRLIFVDQKWPYGPSRLCRTSDTPEDGKYDLFFDPKGVAWSICFHPKFAENGYLYLGSNGDPLTTGATGKHTKIVRYTLARTAPYALDPKSELLIVEWPSDGHNGGAMAFGKDGMLYVTSGDGTSDSDTNLKGQGLDHLLSKVLRIDVDHPEPGKPYSVPKDNPFVDRPGARPETWAYGLRNPWRMTCDAVTGAIWVGNNGQDLYEQIYRIEKGANYGWSVMEGGHPFYLDREKGPTPFVKPTTEHPHSDARSLTGGVVYHGAKLPELRGAYLYGDYSTGKIWGVRHDGQRVTWHKEIADTTLAITDFFLDHEGEPYVVDFRGSDGGGIYRLEPQPPADNSRFPRTLSASSGRAAYDATLESVMESGNSAAVENDDANRLPGIVRELSELIVRHQATIAAHQPKSLVNRTGYRLHGVLQNGQLDLAKMLVGSEGTLALITEATVRIEPLPRFRGVALLFFDRLEGAARGALEVTSLGVAACDLLDRRLLTIARENDVRYDLLIPREAEAMLLVEVQGDEQGEVREKLQQIVSRLQRRKRMAFDARTTMDREERDLYWRLARRVAPSLYRLRGSTRPVPFVEDMAVPPQALPEFLLRVQNVLKSHHVTASLFSHAGHGQVHLRPFLDLSDARDVRMMQDLATDLYGHVLELGGTISGEHGDGLSRSWFIKRQYGPLYDVFREVKRIFDPLNTLNPGKVVADAPQLLTQNMRPTPALVNPRLWDDSVTLSGIGASGAGSSANLFVDRPFDAKHDGAPPSELGNGEAAPAPPEKPIPAPIDLQLHWSPAELPQAVRNCNGCGRCRTQSLPERMCPIFRMAPAEEASPRAKANLMRALLSGRLGAERLVNDDIKQVADLCVHCHQCRLECPAEVDIPKLMVECKAQYVAKNGLRTEDWFLTRIDKVSALAGRVAPLSNYMLGNRFFRWLLEKTFGIAQGRKLPRLAQRTFLKRAAKRRLTRASRGAGRKALYFVDIYANWYDVELAEAFTAVLAHNGVAVFVHPAQKPAGMPQVSLGAIDDARRLALKNVSILAEAVRQGYTIVATEPSAALCLSHEYPNLLDDDEARLVASHTQEACSYLWKLHQQGKLELDLSPLNLNLAYHLPCHVQALGQGAAGENLLRLIPGVTVQRIEKGCSGMAGIYGLKKENYRSSLRAGWGLISALRDPAINVGVTECSTCKMQMEQGSSKPTIHPIKLLAYAYGLMPQLEQSLTARGKDLATT